MAASWVYVALKLEDRDSAFAARELRTIVSGATTARLEKRRVVEGLKNLLNAIKGNTYPGQLYVGVSADHATKQSWSVACTQANAANDTVTITIGGVAVTFTEGSADATLGFARGASNTTCASALAAVINAHPVLKYFLTASPSTGTVTVTSKVGPGVAHLMATNDATAFAITPTVGTLGTNAISFQHVLMGRTP